MDRPIEEALARLSTSATHAGLDGLEDRVFRAIAAEPVWMVGAGAALTAGTFALLFGVISNIVPAADAQAAPALSPFGASSPLAPSTLLVAP